MRDVNLPGLAALRAVPRSGLVSGLTDTESEKGGNAQKEHSEVFLPPKDMRLRLGHTGGTGRIAPEPFHPGPLGLLEGMFITPHEDDETRERYQRVVLGRLLALPPGRSASGPHCQESGRLPR